MKKTRTKKILLISAVIAVIAIGSYAYADWGRGYGRHMDYGWGSGYGPGRMMGYQGEGCGGWGPVSAEDARKMEKERADFHKETEALRQDIYTKRRDLRSELAKDAPSAEKASALQRELSGLEGQLDQKQIGHLIALRKISPDTAGRYAGRGMMGDGFGGYGSCW